MKKEFRRRVEPREKYMRSLYYFLWLGGGAKNIILSKGLQTMPPCASDKGRVRVKTLV